MRTNLFRFIKLKKNKIVIEEETLESPFLLFLNRYKRFILPILILLAFIAVITSIWFAVINIRETSKIFSDINNVVVDFQGSTTVNSVNMKPITGGHAIQEFYERYGNIGLREGIIFKVKSVNFITYYSDGSAKIVDKHGNITRISALENGEYGIKENGDIIIGAKTKRISIEKTIVLEDGTTVTYYSDNTCEVIIPSKKITMIVRNSDRLVIRNNRLFNITPSGVSDILKNENITGTKVTYYEDGTIKLKKGNNVYIVRDINDVNINNLTFPNNNAATILNTVNLKDGSKIIYYTDGSAEIIKKDESIMVRASKDIIYTEKRVIEITETRYALETITKKTPKGEEIIYLNNGGALIKNPNGTYEYVYENSDIKYDNNGNIKSVLNRVKEILNKKTPDGTIIINLEDKNSIIIDENGYRVVETKKIIYYPNNDIKGIEGEFEKDTDDNSISDNYFIIDNQGRDDVRIKITLEVSDDYEKYAPIKLDPMYLRYNIVVGSKYMEDQLFDKKMEIGTELQGGNKIEKETYILYEGTLLSGYKEEVNLGVWLDYDDITNDYQNSVFVGTIKIYSETIEKEK